MTSAFLPTPGHPTRWGIVGPGAIAHQFADALHALPASRLTAVFSRSAERGAAFAAFTAQHSSGPVAVYTDLDALLADTNVDAVYIATPHTAHGDAVAASLRAGKPVLCEKPLVTSAAQAQVLIGLSQTCGVFLMEALWTRFLPALQKAQQLLQQGAIGSVQRMQSSFGFALPYEPTARHFAAALGGGTLLDIGIYNLSLSQWVLALMDDHRDDHAAPTFTISGRLAPTGVEQQAHVHLRYASGVTSDFVCAFDEAFDNHFHIHGSAGTLTLNAGFWQCQSLTLQRHGQADEHIACPFVRNGFEYQIAAAQAAIQLGQIECSVMPHAQTLATLSLIDQLRASLGVSTAPG
jgi:predicted dehydrogenase